MKTIISLGLLFLVGIFAIAYVVQNDTWISSAFAASSVNAMVERDIMLAEKTGISVNDKKFQIVAMMPIDIGEKPGLALQLSGEGKEANLFLPIAMLEAITEGKKPDNTIKAAFAYDETSVYIGDLSAGLDENKYLQLAGTLRNDENGKTVLISAIIHEANGGMGNTTLELEKDRFVLNGTLGTMSYLQMKQAIEANPHIRILYLEAIDGSVNDDVNVHTGRLVRSAGLTTMVSRTSKIYSGGVDLFAAGSERYYEDGAEIGVHSWCCFEEKTAAELPRNHPAHASQLAYFKEMLGEPNGPEFYFHTLNAAPFDGISLMSSVEIERFNLAKPAENISR